MKNIALPEANMLLLKFIYNMIYKHKVISTLNGINNSYPICFLQNLIKLLKACFISRQRLYTQNYIILSLPLIKIC